MKGKDSSYSKKDSGRSFARLPDISLLGVSAIAIPKSNRTL